MVEMGSEMYPNDQPQRQIEQSPQGTNPQGSGMPPEVHPESGGQATVGQRKPISEMSVSTPTLRWISIPHPQEQVPIGTDDYVLDSSYNPSMDAWEVLVLIQPDETDEEEEEDE